MVLYKNSIRFNIQKNHILKKGLKRMRISSLPKGGICEVSFGYHFKMGGYTSLMSDIPTLGDIAE